jgi:hypothetical protein
MAPLIATHPNKTELRANSETKEITLKIPTQLIECTAEHLENNRSFNIYKCSFFEGYIGLNQEELTRVLCRVLLKMSQENTILRYLLDKGFEVSSPEVITDLSDYTLHIEIKD